MRITESYLRSLIKQTLKEIINKDIPNEYFPSEDFEEEPVDSNLLADLESKGYKVTKLGNGSYEIIDPKNPFNSGILQPTLKRK